MDLYLAAPADPHFQRRLKEVSGQWTVADWSPDETRVVAEEYISINESYIHIIDVGTGPDHDDHPAAGRPEGRARLLPASPNGPRMASRSTTSPTRGRSSAGWLGTTW